jgi:hypothetical protein
MMPSPAANADTDTDTEIASRAASARELAALRQDFPRFRIWREATGERVRYVAVRQRPGTSLHTLVTADFTELRTVLTQATARTRHPGTPGGLAGQRGQASRNVGPPSAGTDAPLTDEDAARWKEAIQLRRAYTRWLIIWVARAGRFRAYPLASSRARTTLTAPTADDLAAKISQADRAARRARGRSTAGPASEPGNEEVTGP